MLRKYKATINILKLDTEFKDERKNKNKKYILFKRIFFTILGLPSITSQLKKYNYLGKIIFLRTNA